MGYGSETIDVGVTQKELQWLCLHVEKKKAIMLIIRCVMKKYLMLGRI